MHDIERFEKRDLTCLLLVVTQWNMVISQKLLPWNTQEVRGRTPGADQKLRNWGLFINVYKNPTVISFYHPKDVNVSFFQYVRVRVSYSQSLRAAFQNILRRRPMFRRNLQLEMHRCETETWQRKVQGSHGVAIASCLLASDEYLRNVNFKDTTCHDNCLISKLQLRMRKSWRWFWNCLSTRSIQPFGITIYSQVCYCPS